MNRELLNTLIRFALGSEVKIPALRAYLAISSTDCHAPLPL